MSVEVFIEAARRLDVLFPEKYITNLILDYSKNCLWEYDPEKFAYAPLSIVPYASWKEFYHDKVFYADLPLVVHNWAWTKSFDDKNIEHNTLSIYYWSEINAQNLVATIPVSSVLESEVRTFLLGYSKIL